jgi:hypothetical protein
LQRAAISQRQRPIEASLRNRLLIWRFLKKIENEPILTINDDQEFLDQDYQNNQNTITHHNSWMFDLDRVCDTTDDNNNDNNNIHTNGNDDNDDSSIGMDIESDILTIVGSNDLNDSACETMNIEQNPDVTLLLKRAIGAERRQKRSPDHFQMNEAYHSNLHLVTNDSTFEDTEQFFHDLCTELTSTTATLVSSSTSNVLNFSSSPEQTLIH